MVIYVGTLVEIKMGREKKIKKSNKLSKIERGRLVIVLLFLLQKNTSLWGGD